MKLGLIIFAVSITIFLILILCKNNKNNQDNYEADNESCKNKVGAYCDCSGNVYDCSGVCGGENKPSDNGCCPNVENLGCGCGDDPTKAVIPDPSTNCCPDVKDLGCGCDAKSPKQAIPVDPSSKCCPNVKDSDKCGCGDDPTKAIPVDPTSKCCQNVTDLGCGCGDDPKQAINPNKCGGCEKDKDGKDLDCKDNEGVAQMCGNPGDAFPSWADCSGNVWNCDGSKQVPIQNIEDKCVAKACLAEICIGNDKSGTCECKNVDCGCVPDNSKGPGPPGKIIPTFGYNCRTTYN